MKEETGDFSPTLREQFREGFEFWCNAILGVTVAGGLFGLIFGLYSAGILGLYSGLLLGIAISSVYAAFFHFHAAILTWAFWLTRFRVLMAGISGGVTGVLSTAMITGTISTGSWFGDNYFWIVLAGSMGAAGGTWAGYQFTKSMYSRYVRGRIPRSAQWQFTLCELLIHFTVLAVITSVWTSILSLRK